MLGRMPPEESVFVASLLVCDAVGMAHRSEPTETLVFMLLPLCTSLLITDKSLSAAFRSVT